MLRTRLYLFLYIFLTPSYGVAYSPYTDDPLLHAIYSSPTAPPPVPRQEIEELPEDDSEGYPAIDYSAEPQHDSWDNIYLCNYCDLEVITDPYGTHHEARD